MAPVKITNNSDARVTVSVILGGSSQGHPVTVERHSNGELNVDIRESYHRDREANNFQFEVNGRKRLLTEKIDREDLSATAIHLIVSGPFPGAEPYRVAKERDGVPVVRVPP